MSRNAYATPLPIELHPDPRLRYTWLLIVGATLLLAAALALPFWVRALLMAATLAIGWREYQRHFGPHAPTALLWQADGAWLLSSAVGIQRGRLSGRSFSTPPLVLLNFRLEGDGDTPRRQSVLLTPSRCDKETLRRLRVRLRLEQKRIE